MKIMGGPWGGPWTPVHVLYTSLLSLMWCGLRAFTGSVNLQLSCCGQTILQVLLFIHIVIMVTLYACLWAPFPHSCIGDEIDDYSPHIYTLTSYSTTNLVTARENMR